MFEALALVNRSLDLLPGEGGDAFAHDLRWRDGATKDGCRQDEGFSDRIIPLHIIGWVGFGLALCLCLRECFGVCATQRHGTEDRVRRAVEDATDGTDPGSCHPLADGYLARAFPTSPWTPSAVERPVFV